MSAGARLGFAETFEIIRSSIYVESAVDIVPLVLAAQNIPPSQIQQTSNGVFDL
jgi:hypothetical protein